MHPTKIPKVLSEETKVKDSPWLELREEAMKPDFQGSELFLEHYNQEQKNLVK